MAIIYTYPTIDTIEGGDLFLVSDVSEENATRKVTAAEFGGYIQATYGPGTNMYQADGSLTGNRIITGAGFGLDISGVNQFTVTSLSTINLNPDTNVEVGEGKGITTSNTNGTVDAIRDKNKAGNFLRWISRSVGVNGDIATVSGEGGAVIRSGNSSYGIELTNGTSAKTTIKNGVPILSGANNDIADITASVDKALVTKEWVLFSSGTGTVTNIATAGTVNGLTLTGGPITTTGTVTLGGTLAINNSDWVGTSLAIANGGTGASTAQDGINELTQSGGATTGYVLTRDGSGNAVWDAAPSGSSPWNTSGSDINYTAGAVSVGTSSPDASALFQVDSTTRGFLPPRMTTVEMNAVSTPASGLMVFDRTTSQWMGYNGTSWVILG